MPIPPRTAEHREAFRRLLIALQFLALALGLAVTAELSLIFHLYDVSLAALAPAGAYVVLLWAVLRKDQDDWLKAATGWLLRLVLPSLPRVITTIAVLGVATAYFGIWLQRLHLRPNFHLQLFARNPAVPVKDVTVEMQSVEPRLIHADITDDRGIVSFRLSRQQLYLCYLIRDRQGSRWRTGLDNAIKIEDRLLMKDLAAIPENQWTEEPLSAVETAGYASTSLARLGDAFKSLVPTVRSAPPADETQSRLARHLPFGVPAAPLVAAREHYVLGFDLARKSPLWVAYKMNPGEPPPRSTRQFSPDTDLDPALQVTETAYRTSGFDRGHLISRSDIAGYGGEVDAIVGKLSLIVPQYPDFNRRVWTKYEEFCRSLVEQGEVWIITGPVYPEAGEEAKTIGEGIPVPSAIFRVVVRKNPAGRFQAGAFLVPNTDRLDFSEVRQFSLAVQALEARLKLILLPGTESAGNADLRSNAYPW